jgi:hypothetical protein
VRAQHKQQDERANGRGSAREARREPFAFEHTLVAVRHGAARRLQRRTEPSSERLGAVARCAAGATGAPCALARAVHLVVLVLVVVLPGRVAGRVTT